MKRLRNPLALALGIAALGIAVGVGTAAGPYFPAPRANITLAKATRVVHVGHSSRASDFMSLALAYSWLNDQTRDATHQWVVLVDADADITSPGTKPTFTSVIYQANVASTAAACSNGQVQTYVSASNTWSCGSATTGGVAGAGTTVASALASYTDTAGGSIQAAGTATLAGNPALGVSGIALGTTGLIFEGATANTLEGLLIAADPTADRTWTLPDATGTLALSSGVGTSLTFAAAAGGTNVAEITVTVVDGAGATVAAVHHLDLWLSDSATCAGLTGTTASGTVQAKAASGRDITVYTAKKSLRVETLAAGTYILEVTDSAKTGFFVCGTAPATGRAVASAALVTGNYG